MRFLRAGAAIFIASLAILCCSDSGKLPEDPDLEYFIETAAHCAYLERAYSHDSDLLDGEIQQMSVPEGWDSLVDSLVSTYGTDPDFWHRVYIEILERSRKQSVTQEP